MSLEQTFDDMFFNGVDDTERGNEPIESITVRLVHTWNWDGLMEQSVIYSFVKYWEANGNGQLNAYSGRAKRMYQGLKICYDRIVNNTETFFGDHVTNDGKMRHNTIEFIWKYRGCMWD